MKLNKAGIDLMHEFEGCSLEAYLCPANKWTIGYGNTYYENGKPVQQGDKITQQEADHLFGLIAEDFAKRLRNLLRVIINENQFSALVSFAYNTGVANLKKSTLLKKVNANPLDPTITNEFMKWNKGGGKVLAGLTRRREHEYKLYFNETT
jgi:lysozyme